MHARMISKSKCDLSGPENLVVCTGHVLQTHTWNVKEARSSGREVRLLKYWKCAVSLPAGRGRCQDFWLIVSVIPTSAGPKGMVAPKQIRVKEPIGTWM